MLSLDIEQAEMIFLLLLISLTQTQESTDAMLAPEFPFKGVHPPAARPHLALLFVGLKRRIDDSYRRDDARRRIPSAFAS